MTTGSLASQPPLDNVAYDPGSFRDPGARVFERDGRLFRALSPRAADDYVWLRDRGIIGRLIQGGHLVPTAEINPATIGVDPGPIALVLEHERVPFVSYPYEWPFSALKAAALFHLDLHLSLLGQDATLVDASAYNVQFQTGMRPVFIDVPSLRRYRDGEAWAGHRQFCEQFLNPLLLSARRGIAFNAWYRGAMEGIPIGQLARLLTWRDKMSWRVLLHITAPARLQQSARSNGLAASASSRRPTLPKRSLVHLLSGLRTWIAGLTLRPDVDGEWTAYSTTHSYGDEELVAKQRVVADFIAAHCPPLVLDVGCNTGDYATLALIEGAHAVVGLEPDAATADRAFQRAAADGLTFLPLVMDAADPSPARGWREQERRSLSKRAAFDAVMALAFVHHLAIARNVPLDQVVEWLTNLAPRGVIEFVPKTDPTVQRMLALRDDIFDGYTLSAFTGLLSARARIVRQQIISSSGRVLFWYECERH
jgi:ribosomal protein L11 methylase PrmA